MYFDLFMVWVLAQIMFNVNSFITANLFLIFDTHRGGLFEKVIWKQTAFCKLLYLISEEKGNF